MIRPCLTYEGHTAREWAELAVSTADAGRELRIIAAELAGHVTFLIEEVADGMPLDDPVRQAAYRSAMSLCSQLAEMK